VGNEKPTFFGGGLYFYLTFFQIKELINLVRVPDRIKEVIVYIGENPLTLPPFPTWIPINIVIEMNTRKKKIEVIPIIFINVFMIFLNRI
jgi:hypothetical protein